MASAGENEKLAYVFTVLKNMDLPKPNYHAIAIQGGINNANNAQKKFRAIVKAAGFDLVNGQITGADGSRGASLDVLTPPPKRGRAKKADGEASKKSPLRKETTESSAKKRKLAQSPKHADEAGEGKTVRQDVDDEAEPPGQNGQTGAGEG